mmetsp:Transcript_15880/g.36032  ORF Transcript_15880/g.36032 Transcript_15880/m.36032 type:complete len:301 (-) Transcript_15880:278-1180(-)
MIRYVKRKARLDVKAPPAKEALRRGRRQGRPVGIALRVGHEEHRATDAQGPPHVGVVPDVLDLPGLEVVGEAVGLVVVVLLLRLRAQLLLQSLKLSSQVQTRCGLRLAGGRGGGHRCACGGGRPRGQNPETFCLAFCFGVGVVPLGLLLLGRAHHDYLEVHLHVPIVRSQGAVIPFVWRVRVGTGLRVGVILGHIGRQLDGAQPGNSGRVVPPSLLLVLLLLPVAVLSLVVVLHEQVKVLLGPLLGLGLGRPRIGTDGGVECSCLACASSRSSSMAGGVPAACPPPCCCRLLELWQCSYF